MGTQSASERATGSATDSATFGGGCFWCLEAVFDSLAGVQHVASGYCGGPVATPSYEAVCGGNTGHAEVVSLQFDPSVISYRDLLEVFFAIHDPTTPNRQGNDVGSQYRSVIFAHSLEQAATAAEVIAELEAARAFDDPIVTELVPPGSPDTTFWPAEEYHQEYYAHNARQPYCQMVVAPKLKKLRAKFAAKLKKNA